MGMGSKWGSKVFGTVVSRSVADDGWMEIATRPGWRRARECPQQPSRSSLPSLLRYFKIDLPEPLKGFFAFGWMRWANLPFHLEQKVGQSNHQPAITILLAVGEDQNRVQWPLLVPVLGPVALCKVDPSLIFFEQHKEFVDVNFLHHNLVRQRSLFCQKLILLHFPVNAMVGGDNSLRADISPEAPSSFLLYMRTATHLDLWVLSIFLCPKQSIYWSQKIL